MSCTTPKLPAGTALCATDQRIFQAAFPRALAPHQRTELPSSSASSQSPPPPACSGDNGVAPTSESSGLRGAAWERATEMPEPGCRSQHEGHRAVWLPPLGGDTADFSRMGDMKEPVSAPCLGGCQGPMTCASEPRRSAQRFELGAPTTTPLGADSRVGQSQGSGWADTGELS